jgi:predicted PurR-regulated permease PerM
VDFQTATLLTLAVLLFFSMLVIGGLVLSARAYAQLIELTKLLSRLVVRDNARIRHLERSDHQHRGSKEQNETPTKRQED